MPEQTWSRDNLIANGYGQWAPQVLRGALEGVAKLSFTASEITQLVASWLTTPVASVPVQAAGYRAVVLPVDEAPADGDSVTYHNGQWVAGVPGTGGLSIPPAVYVQQAQPVADAPFVWGQTDGAGTITNVFLAVP